MLEPARWDGASIRLLDVGPAAAIVNAVPAQLLGYPATPLASAELFDPGTGTWRAAARMAHSRVGRTATVLATGEVLVAGGLGDCLLFCRQLSAAELYAP